jgi:hypothetical protein
MSAAYFTKNLTSIWTTWSLDLSSGKLDTSTMASKNWRKALAYDDPRTTPPPADAVHWIGWRTEDNDKAPNERKQAEIVCQTYYKAREWIRAELHTDAVTVVQGEMPK